MANWNPTHENIARIASVLNLGADSFVLIDEDPAERAIVEAQVDAIAVPDVGSDLAGRTSVELPIPFSTWLGRATAANRLNVIPPSTDAVIALDDLPTSFSR